MLKQKLIRKILIIVLIAVGLYAIFLLVSDFSIIYDKITNFNVIYLAPILALVSCSWLVLFLRWSVLLNKAEITIPKKDSLLIYLSSYSLAATPGQLGELIKSQLLKNKFDVPLAKTAPLVVIERLYDLTGALIVSILGIWFLGIGIFIIAAAATMLGLIFVLLNSKTAFDKALSVIGNVKFLKKATESLSNSHDSIQRSIKGRTFFVSIALSIIYWFLLGASAYLTLLSLGIDTIGVLNMISIYSSSLILSAVSLIPGGVGIAEGSIAGLLTLGGVDISIAFVLGILIRIFTLWYAVLVGFITLKINGGLQNDF